MTTLDPVYAVELEPGLWLNGQSLPDKHMPALVGRLMADRDVSWFRVHGYPHARVVKFRLEEVRDDENG